MDHGAAVDATTAAKLHLATASLGRPDTKVGDLCEELGINRLML